MAATTLPYPGMDFVPLDVLTADELDHLVANIEAVNNASIGSATLNNYSTTAQMNTAISTAITSANVPVITMTTTDPGAGSALAANHFVGVYS